MRATQFIPEQYKLHISRYGTQEIPRGFPLPYSTTPEVQKEINRVIGGYSENAITYNNTPMAGYHIMVDGESVQIFHPDGYAIKLTMYNIGIILRECQINQGMIDDELIFIFDKSYKEYILVPYNRDTYQEIKKQSDEFYAAKTGSTNLVYGCTINFNGSKFVYLGSIWMTSISHTGIKIVNRYIIKNKMGKYYFTTVKAPDSITDEHVTDFPEESMLMDELHKNDVYEITSFYKSGSFNWRNLNLSNIHLSTTKENKKDFIFDYTENHEEYSTIRGFPIFISDDGKLYAACNHYQNGLAYSLGTYDTGRKISAIPYDISTLSANTELDDNAKYKFRESKIIKKIVLPVVVKK